MINSSAQVNNIDNERFEGNHDMLGVYSRNIPGLNQCDMNRAHMSNCEQEQAVQLFNAEFPLYNSGFENEFSKWSSGYTKLEGTWKVIKRIDKNPYNYALIIKKLEYSPKEKKRLKKSQSVKHVKGEYHVLFRQECYNLTESYGCIMNNEIMDSLESGDIIEDEVINHDLNRDDNMNLTYGLNVNSVYTARGGWVTEDAIRISKRFSKRAAYPTVPKPRVTLNDNDILVNLYGNKNYYKAFPDIGEEIKNGILCSSRRVSYEKTPFTLRKMTHRLHDDTNYFVNGIVVDIDVISNVDNPDEVFKMVPNIQIGKYWRQQQNYFKNFVKYTEKIITGKDNICSDDLIHFYNLFKIRTDPNIKFRVDKSVFSHLIIDFTILSRHDLIEGNKMAGRYGDKGVISEIFTEEEALELEDFAGLGPVDPDTEVDLHVDMEINPLGVPNRMNPAQNNEHEINGCSLFVRYKMEQMLKSGESVEDVLDYLYGYFEVIKMDQLEGLKEFVNNLDEEETMNFIHGLIKYGIPIQSSPFFNNLNVVTLRDVYEYTGMKPSKFKGIEEPLILGTKFYIVLKHFPNTKFSARSIDQLSIKNLPTKNPAYKEFKSNYSSTPIKFGEMEVIGLNIANAADKDGMKKVKNYLDCYANNETDRIQFIMKQIKDNPYEFNFESSGTRSENSKIVRTFLRAIGIDIVDD